MADWDQDSPQLRKNLRAVLAGIRNAARQRNALSLEQFRAWHCDMMKGLTAPKAAWVGRYRGEKGLESIEVSIGTHSGSPAKEVASELASFHSRLVLLLSRLDQAIAADAELTADQLEAVLEVCAWAHAQWVKIHPFANGNGRTARLLANAIAMRYGLPPFVRLRPRPNHGYNRAAEAAMRGDHRPLVKAFRHMLEASLSGQ